VECGKINLDLIKSTRDQFFAEAVAAVTAGDTWWEMPDAETRAEQESRRQSDAWEGVVYDFLIGKDSVSVADVATLALNIDISKLDRSSQIRITAILRMFGWQKTSSFNGDKVVRLWVPKTTEGVQSEN